MNHSNLRTCFYMLDKHCASLFQPRYVDGLLNPSHRILSFTTPPSSCTIELLHSSMMVLPNILYRVPYRTPLINTIYPRTILQPPSRHTVFTPAPSIFSTDMNFLARFGMCSTPGRVLILPCFSFSLTLPCPMILAGESSPRYTSPSLHFSYSQNHSL